MRLGGAKMLKVLYNLWGGRRLAAAAWPEYCSSSFAVYANYH
jgi:hypothetical protein